MDEERELEGKVMVPAGKAGGLIGKGGEVINQLRSSAGCGSLCASALGTECAQPAQRRPEGLDALGRLASEGGFPALQSLLLGTNRIGARLVEG